MDIDKYQEETSPLDESLLSKTIDYNSIMQEEAFIGEYPFNAILSGIENQFLDYINLEDDTNYVDIFYDQMSKSRQLLESNDEDDHGMEITEILDNLTDQFIQKMYDLFRLRLMITIECIDSESIDYDKLEGILKVSYNFFILNAKDNFTKVITKDIMKTLPRCNDDDEYFREVDTQMIRYSPLIMNMKMNEFFDYIPNSEDIKEMFENGDLLGNFLRKYSPKLYENEEFHAELVSNIIILQEFKDEVLLNG